MAINFNTEPYYDDYDEDKKFYKILFKPGVSVQARELTQLQTIIQKQIERHGDHMFKQGARVSGGEFGYTDSFHAVKLQDATGGALLADFIDQLVDVELRGATSGVVGKVVTVRKATSTDSNTIYVSYTSSGDDKVTNTFLDGEILIAVDETINGVVAGNPLLTTIADNATSLAASADIRRGVYYVNGHFVLVENQRIILDKYDNTPSARVGLEIIETVVDADEDQSLLDTAQNAPNFSARGADRYSIILTLATRSLDDLDDTNFIELERIIDGRIKAKAKTSEYSTLEDNLARRTFDESGDYVVNPFQLKLKETLDDGTNNGVYKEGKVTDSGNLPSDDLATLQVSSGKAYVRGYEVALNSPAFLDVEKPRETITVGSTSSTMDLGNYVRAVNVSGTPNISTNSGSLDNYSEVGLYDSTSSGTLIGVCRVRAMELESASPSGSVDYIDADGQFRFFLFDIKVFTEITATGTLTAGQLPTGSQIKGSQSGATGYVYSTSGDKVYITSTVGDFRDGESIQCSERNYGVVTNGTIDSVKSYAFDNVKQLSATDFDAELVLESSYTLSGFANVSGTTVTGLNALYSTELVVGDAVSLPTGANGSLEIRYIDAISNNQLTLDTATTNNATSVVIYRQRAFINDQEKHILLRRIEKDFTSNVEDVDIIARRQFVDTADLNSQITITCATGEKFGVPNNIDYQIVALSGTNAGKVVNVEAIDTITGAGTTQLTLTDSTIFENNVDYKIVATITKTSQTEKSKVFRPCELVDVENLKDETSGVVYGTSANHKEISLGQADATEILAIYDSRTVGTAATIPSVTLGQINGSFSKGEVIRGNSSGATARIIDTISPLRYVSVNGVSFVSGETIEGLDTNTTSIVNSVTAGDNNILNRYLLDTGQRDNYYDVSKLVLKPGAKAPKGDIVVVFNYFEHGAGDFFSVNSYAGIDYADIPTYSATRIDPEIRNPNGIYDLRSTMDFRPRVANITSTASTRVTGASIVTDYSFDFKSRNFDDAGSSKVDIPKDNSSFNYGYSYYTARKDAFFITTAGELRIVKGNPSENPKRPADIDNAMRVADIEMPPYVIDVADISITKTTNRRYTMKDIGKLEQRLNNVEYYTSLSLLEKSAEVLQVKDANGLDRFKSGFLVDNFGGHKTGDVLSQDYRCAIDMTARVLRPKYKMKNVKLEEIATTPAERYGKHYVSNGDIVTLPYTEVETISQPYATRVENLNPVLNFGWTGILKLEPSSDEWFEIERLPDVVNNVEGNFNTIVAQNKNAIGTVWNAPTTEWTGILINEQQTERRETRFVDLGQTRGRAVLTRTTADEVGVQTRSGIETTVVEQIDVTSNGDRVVATALIPYMRQNRVYFEASGLKPLTRVYPFFDKVDVSSYVTPTSGSITTNEGESGTIAQGAATWDKVKAVMLSYDNNTGKAIDIELSRSYNAKKVTSWSGGSTTLFTVTSNSLGTPQLIATDFYQANQAAFSSAPTVNAGNALVRASSVDFSLASGYEIKKLKGSIVDLLVLTATSFRLQVSFSGLGLYSQLYYWNGSGWILGATSTLTGGDQALSFDVAQDGAVEGISSQEFKAASTSRSINRSVTTFEFESGLTPSEFGDSFFRVEFKDRNEDNALSAFQISEVIFFDENYDASEDLQWNLTNALIPNVNHAEVVGSFNFKNVKNVADGGTLIDNGDGTWLIDGVNYRSDVSSYSEATVAVAGKRHAYIDIRLRGGTRLIDSSTGLERFAAPGATAGSALVSDAGGFLSGFFDIPDPNVAGNPVFETGDRTLRLSSSAENADESIETFAQANYSAKGILETKQETFTATRNGRVETREVTENVQVTRQRDLGEEVTGWWDPLAQSIMPSTPGGEFITSIEVFFAQKDESIPVTLQLREMENGTPTRKVIPFGSKTLYPSDVSTSQAADQPTRFTFDAPVYVKENVEIAVVVMTDSDKYLAWISRMGENDISGSRSVSEQPYLGVLFKSQNNSTWTAYDYEDLKFNVYRASFDTSKNGLVELGNAEVPMARLGSDPIQTVTGSSIVKVNHDDHHMYDTSTGTGNYAMLTGLTSGIAGTLNEFMETSESTIVIDGAVDAGFPDDGQLHYYVIKSANLEEVGDEIIGGTPSVSNDVYTVTVSQRGVGNTTIIAHPEDSVVEWYEVNGIPLQNLNNTPLQIQEAGLDWYSVDVTVNATETDSFGGSSVMASNNALVDSYQLMVPVINFPDTNVKTTVDFLNGTSPSGSQVSYGQYGASVSELIDRIDLRRPGMIASSVNELQRNNAENSSTVVFEMSSSKENLSPVIDLERKSITAYGNRLDEVRSSADVYTESEYVEPTAPEGDSGEAIYITKRVQLQNPATSIKVILDAVRNPSSDIQVMYKVLRSDDSTDFDELGWSYFNSAGEADVPVSAVSDRSSFKEYQFTQDDIPEFISFAIKIKMNGTNSSEPPLIKDLRAIALAL